MAIEFIQAVWEISPYKAEKLLVQIACADWANADGEFWPTYDDIAHKARVTKPGAIGIIQQMIEDGEIEIKEHSAGGRGKRNRYRFSDDYLQAVGKVRQAWAEARERKGKRGLPKSEREKVNEDYRIKTEKVNENGIKGKPEIAHIRNNRHEPSEIHDTPSFDGFISHTWQAVYKEPITIHALTTLTAAGITNQQAFLKAIQTWKTNAYSTRNLTGLIGLYQNEAAKQDMAKPIATTPRYSCYRCKDRFAYVENGQTVKCDCWQKEAA